MVNLFWNWWGMWKCDLFFAFQWNHWRNFGKSNKEFIGNLKPKDLRNVFLGFRSRWRPFSVTGPALYHPCRRRIDVAALILLSFLLGRTCGPCGFVSRSVTRLLCFSSPINWSPAVSVSSLWVRTFTNLLPFGNQESTINCGLLHDMLHVGTQKYHLKQPFRERIFCTNSLDSFWFSGSVPSCFARI